MYHMVCFTNKQLKFKKILKIYKIYKYYLVRRKDICKVVEILYKLNNKDKQNILLFNFI